MRVPEAELVDNSFAVKRLGREPTEIDTFVTLDLR